MVRRALVFRVVLFVALVGSAFMAQVPAMTTAVESDADVLGAERLFSAWLEGQIAYKGLPGVAVGVVSDQQLVWAKGFGLADLQQKRR
jgi:CubicO group peptidase (beta-lactamase class C family)